MCNKTLLSTFILTALCVASLPARGTDAPGADKVAKQASVAAATAKQQAVSADLPGNQDGDLLPPASGSSSIQLSPPVNAQPGMSPGSSSSAATAIGPRSHWRMPSRRPCYWPMV